MIWLLKNHILKSHIKKVLDREILDPFMKSISHDPIAFLKLSNAFVLIRLSENLIIEFDKSETDSDKDINSIKEKNLYLGYLGKVYESSLILVGATDYLGAIVLLRTVFELLIGIATDNTGSMKERIFSINYLKEGEKKSIHKFWNELSAWAHPYGKWINNICPKFYGIGRNHHPAIFEQCLNYTDYILDLMLTITIEQFKLGPGTYISKYKEISETVDFFEVSKLEMFKNRVKFDS